MLAVAVKAAETAVKLTAEKDAEALLDLAESYFAVGDKSPWAVICKTRALRASGRRRCALSTGT